MPLKVVAMTANNDPDDIASLPSHPRPEQLLEAYLLCRSKLVRANRSRSALRTHDEKRIKFIRNLQEQLNTLEASLQEEAASRIMVHQLNAKIAEIVKELETGLDETAKIVEEKGDGGLTDWVVRMARLLPIVNRLREVKASAVRMLSGAGVEHRELPVIEEAIQSLPELDIKSVPLALPPPPPPSAAAVQLEIRGTEPQTQVFGPLLLKDFGYALSPLLLHSNDLAVPAGLKTAQVYDLVPGKTLLVLESQEDTYYAAIDAAIDALNSENSLPQLKPWLNLGVLPFVVDPSLHLLRLIPFEKLERATHVLVHKDLAAGFEDVGATSLTLEMDDDLWLGFAITAEEDTEALRGLIHHPGQQRESTVRISCRGGVRMPDGQGYLATGLGLPLLAVPREIQAEAVELQLQDGSVLLYERLANDDQASTRRLWQPSSQIRRRPKLAEGYALFKAAITEDLALERSIRLTSLPQRVKFQRSQPLGFREDWGVNLGSLALPQPISQITDPSDESLRWARQRLNEGNLTVNHLFEQQMLEGLCALFQRRASIPRRDFLQLYAQLRQKPDEWPGFPDAVLRGWCEGGWLEEGIEQGSGRWRIQPVDPRLVRLDRGGVQLVGLLSARGLVGLLASAHQHGLTVQAVTPTCADMPRGWRFQGETEALAIASGLPLVEQSDWVPDPSQHLWFIEAPLSSDSPPWPSGQNSRRVSDAICGRRGSDQHWKPLEPFPERGRAPVSLKIQAETSQYGKRRWHSHDPVSDTLFSSCHRNRVALHALIVATDGLWPFGFTDSSTGQLDRLYDADAYLPLPIGRYAAITGSKMPGPTRHQPSDHTYRYHLDLALRAFQNKSSLLPLSMPPS